MKNKKGFTLIEMLAIIVILALIAVITVPVINGILQDSKKNIAMDSAYGYISAVNRLYYSNSMNDEEDVDNGVYSVSELKVMGLSFSGEEPKEGWVQLEDGEVVSYSLKIRDYVITKYGDSDISVNKGDVNLSPGVVKSDGATYLSSVREVYFNPTKGTNGEVCKSTDSGCLHWYLYSIKGDYANMLLDHNLTEANSSSGVWVSKSDYENSSKSTSAGLSYPGVASFPEYDVEHGVVNRGPVTALNTLKTLTSSWKTGTPKVPNGLGVNEYIIPSSQNNDMYQIDYTGYHARLLTYDEIINFGCSLYECPEWAMKGTFGENPTTFENIYGYWTSSFNYNSTNYAWNVNASGSPVSNFVNNNGIGVRPVVTVLVSDVLS